MLLVARTSNLVSQRRFATCRWRASSKLLTTFCGTPSDGDIESNGRRCVELEARYGAHNYHPLPVVLSTAKGTFLCELPYVDSKYQYRTGTVPVYR